MLELQVPLLAAKALILLLLFAFIYAVMSRSIGDLRKIPDDEPYVPGQSRDAQRARGATGLAAPRRRPRARRRGLGDPGARDPLRRSATARPASAARRASNIVLKSDDYASGRHAQLTSHGGLLYVEDLGSTNGTFVNGRKTVGATPLEKRGHRAGRLDHLQVRGVGPCLSWSCSRSASPTPGKVRQNNEDALLVGEGGDETLFVVADGIGGFEAGEVASSIAVDVLKESPPGRTLRDGHSGGEPQDPRRGPRRREALGDGHDGRRHKVRRHAEGAHSRGRARRRLAGLPGARRRDEARNRGPLARRRAGAQRRPDQGPGRRASRRRTSSPALWARRRRSTSTPPCCP